jgi:hypothetical protein
MIYISVGPKNQRLIILDAHNLEALKKGKQAATPDKHVMIAYTPDIGWTAEQLIQMSGVFVGSGGLVGIDPFKLDAILEEGLTRPIAPQQPEHPHIDVLKGTKTHG